MHLFSALRRWIRRRSLPFRSGLPAIPICLSLLLPAVSAAAPAAMNDDTPIRVAADNMDYDTRRNTVIFTGNVEVRREQFLLRAAIITLYLRPDNERGPDRAGGTPEMSSGSLDRIVAEKNVRFRYNSQTGEAGKATYTADNSVLLLEGSPVIRDGKNSITGNTIRYYMNENRSEVEGGPRKRVEAVFQANGQAGGR